MFSNNAYKSIFVILILLGILLVSNQKIESLSSKSENQQNVTSALSQEDYLKVKEEFSILLNQENPKVAIAELRARSKTNGSLIISCHPLVHALGQEAYKKYKTFGEAVRYKDEFCNSGYLHGVIESSFAKSKDVFTSMRTICSSYEEETFLSWECYHGVGHGLMFFTDNNLPHSINICSEYPLEFAREGCVNGVFMENFNTEQKIHPSKFLRKQNPFYPCEEQKKEYQGDCYLYAPTYYLSLNQGSYSEALVWCRQAEGVNKNFCFQGVGSEVLKANFGNYRFAENVCESGEFSETQNCIFGMATFYSYYHGNVAATRQLCSKLKVQHRGVCFNSLQLLSKKFS